MQKIKREFENSDEIYEHIDKDMDKLDLRHYDYGKGAKEIIYYVNEKIGDAESFYVYVTFFDEELAHVMLVVRDDMLVDFREARNYDSDIIASEIEKIITYNR